MVILDKLFELGDTKYKDFHSSLCPTVDSGKIIGVRVPKIKKLAKELYKVDKEAYKKVGNTYYEEKLLKGLLIALYSNDNANCFDLIKSFVKEIDNWAICDTFCSFIKIKKSDRDKYYSFIKKFCKSKKEYELRFIIVMLLDHYIDYEYLEEDYSIINNIYIEDYYVKMAVAWFVSFSYIKYPEFTLSMLKDISLDKWTYNKALQKILESNRVSKKDKEMIKKLKVK